MNEPLSIAQSDATLELTLNRPDHRNALSRDLIARLTDALRRAATDDRIRSVVLTGTPPAFCAGLDLREVAGTPDAATEHDTTALLELYETIDYLPKPVIAAVNGPAAAGGAGLASVCDIVVCGAAARIGYPGIRHGLVAPVVMTYLLRLVGERRAKFLLLTGELLTAAQAVEYGLAHEVASDADLLARARHYAAQFAAFPPEAVARTKAVLARLRELHGTERIEEARRLSVSVTFTDAARDSILRFLET